MLKASDVLAKKDKKSDKKTKGSSLVDWISKRRGSKKSKADSDDEQAEE